MFARNALIVGSGLIGAHIAHRLDGQPEYGLSPLGYLDDDPPPHLPDRRFPVLGGLSDFRTVASDHDIEHVIIAFSRCPDRRLLDIIRCGQGMGLEVSQIPRFFDAMTPRIQLEHIGGMPMLNIRRIDPRGWQFAVKHAFDRVGAAILLLLLSPLMVAIAVAVKLSSPGPLLYAA